MTIKVKVILAHIVVFGLMISCFSYIVYQSTRKAEIAKLDAYLDDHTTKLQGEIEEQLTERTFPVLSDIHEIRTEGLVNPHLEVLQLDGKTIIVDSTINRFPIPNGEVVKLRGKENRTIASQGRHYRLRVTTVDDNDTAKYVIALAEPMKTIGEFLEHLRWLFLVSIPVALLLAAIAAYLITKSAFKPLTAMIATANKISADNLDTRLTLPDSNNELRQLGKTLNGMIERIHVSFESQRRFIADASHELRTPLTVICSELEYIEGQTKEYQTKLGIQTSLSEVDRLVKMTEAMLMLSKLDASSLQLVLQPFRVDELLIDCTQSMRMLFKQKGVDVQVQIEEAIEIVADEEKLKQVLMNLLDNAMKYTELGGTVTARLTLLPNQVLPVQITIADTGIGISQSDLSRIFERFYRGETSRAEGIGNGLGLSICEQLIKLHGGTLSIQSEVGVGTECTIQLPMKVVTATS